MSYPRYNQGKPQSEASEELADLLILILGHSLAMKVDLESEFHMKMDKIMIRDSKKGRFGNQGYGIS